MDACDTQVISRIRKDTSCGTTILDSEETDNASAFPKGIQEPLDHPKGWTLPLLIAGSPRERSPSKGSDVAAESCPKGLSSKQVDTETPSLGLPHQHLPSLPKGVNEDVVLPTISTPKGAGQLPPTSEPSAEAANLSIAASTIGYLE